MTTHIKYYLLKAQGVTLSLSKGDVGKGLCAPWFDKLTMTPFALYNRALKTQGVTLSLSKGDVGKGLCARASTSSA